MGGGADYQARVSAWVSVHMLAEKDAEAPFGLKAPVARIACEGSEPVDDLIVTTAAGRIAYVQVKRAVRLDSVRCRAGRLVPLASAIDQYVRQFAIEKTVAWDGEDPSDGAHDRFVMAVGADAPATIRSTLREALDRVRAFPGPELPRDGLDETRKKALSVVTQHVRASWIEATGAAPAVHDVRNILNLLHVETIEVCEGERDEQAAKTMLRTTVLETPDQATVAWTVLVNEALRLIRTRGQADRARLLEVLSLADVYVRAPRTYREDIQRIKDHSDRVTTLLEEHASIRLGSVDLRMQRPCVSLLREAAETGSVLVVGEPGAGKSGVLYALSATLRKEGREVVVLAAQQPAFESLGRLRDELLLDHDVVDVLANWPGTSPAFLLIDALDSARTELSAAALRALIREVDECGDRWSVVASIREYDARYSRELARIFQGTISVGHMPALPGGEFARVRHIVVGRLTDDEIQQISELGSPELAQILESAPTAVGELLHNPFNLRLAAELLDGGTDPEAIRDVRSQLDLLDLYWKERVLGGGSNHDAPSREAVLRDVVAAMSCERVLQVDQDLIQTVVAGSHISDLLSEQVIVEWRPRPEDSPRSSTLAFAHHVLFDYAVARLLLRRSASRLAEFLKKDPAFVLLGRPSIVMHFHYLWDLSPGTPGKAREEFWRAVLAVCGSVGIPEIGKLIGPSVSGDIGLVISEFEPLLMALANADDATRLSGEKALSYCVRALLAAGTPPVRLGLCCDLAKRLSDTLTIGSAYPTSWIVSDLVAKLDQLPFAQAEQVGTASRFLLAFAWAQSPRNNWLVGKAIQFVSRTLATDIGASSELLRRTIEPNHLAHHGSEELKWLADVLTSIIPHAPVLVRDIFQAAFGYREASDAPSPLGGSKILSLVSTRRQDYRIALYQLVQSYPEFLRLAPREAVEAMNAALEEHVFYEYSSSDEEAAEFDLDGKQALLLTDNSCIWDDGRDHPGEDAIELLDHVQRRLEHLADEKEAAAKLTNLLDALVRTCRLAVVWRRLLGLGARYPTQIGMKLRAVGWSRPVLMCPDTIEAVGKMNGVLFPDLSEVDRERIERAILSIPEVTPSKSRYWGEQTRDQLLGYLPDDRLVTSETRAHLSALDAADAVPRNEDGFILQHGSPALGESDTPANDGVPVEECPTILRELEASVKKFANTSNVRESEEVAAVLSNMRRLYAALQSEKNIDYAWISLAKACAAIANVESLSCHEEAGAFVRTVLLEASWHRVPSVETDAVDSFTESSWSSSVRVDAAVGIMTILRHPSGGDEDLLAAIKRLANDPVSSVRRQIARQLSNRYPRDPDWTWTMIERMAHDRSLQVLAGLVEGPLNSLKFEDPERVANTTIEIQKAVEDAPNRKQIANSCVEILADLFAWDRNAVASAVIDRLAEDPVAHLGEVRYLVAYFRKFLVTGNVNLPDPDVDTSRDRCWRFLLRVTRRSVAEFWRGVERVKLTDHIVEDSSTEEQMKDILDLIDSVGSDIYFVSGARDNAKSLGERERRRFYTESREVIDVLADVGQPWLSHHLLEVLETLISVDPRGVFCRIARVIRGGRKGGYEYDRMAEDVIVRIVDRYLADHRELFQDDEDARRHLIEVLDTFVDAGSEGARRLSYGLEQIFR